MIELIRVASALSDGAWLDALLRAALRGAVLLLAAGCAALLLRRASAAARHLVWALAFAGLLALPVLPVLLPELQVPLPRAGLELLHRAGVEAPELPEVEIPFSVEVAPDPDPDPLPDPDPQLATAADAVLAGQAAMREAEARAAAAGEAAAEVHHGALALGWPLLLLASWAAGAALALGSLLLGVLRARRAGAGALPVEEGPLAGLLERLRAEAGVARPVALLRGGAAAMPATWGVLRPRILLPAGAEEWPAERLRSVLLHELAHVRRGDWAVQLAAEAACALYWFNPLAWAAARRLRAESEHACDDRVLCAGSRPSDYAGHLLEVARTLRGPRGAHAATLAMARPAEIRVRLLAVLAQERSRGPVSRRFAAPVLVAASLAVAVLAALRPVARGEAAPVDAPPPAAREQSAGAAPPSAPARARPAEPGAAGGALDRDARSAETSPPSVAGDRCPETGGFSRHEEDHDGRLEAEWHNQRGCGGRLESSGRVGYTADRADVAGVAPGGRFVIELYDARDRRRAEVVPAAGGVRRTFTVNGRARPWDAEARRWMAGALAEYFRAMKPAPAPPAPPAPGRVEGRASLAPAGASDGDRAAVLVSALAGRVGPDVVRTVLREARSLGSEGDRADVLHAAARRSSGDQALLREVVAGARGISSPANRVYVLLAVAASENLEFATQRELADAIGGIASDEYRARALRDFARRFGTGNAAVREAFFRSLEETGSSRDRASVLLALADRGPLEGAVREDFLRAARGIGSDAERERVLARVRPGEAAPPASDTIPEGSSRTTLSWSESPSGRRATLEARDAEVDGRAVVRIRPGGFVVVDESHGGFRQRVRVEPGPDGRLRRSYSGDSVGPSRRLEWEAELIARFSGGKRARW